MTNVGFYVVYVVKKVGTVVFIGQRQTAGYTVLCLYVHIFVRTATPQLQLVHTDHDRAIKRYDL